MYNVHNHIPIRTKQYGVMELYRLPSSDTKMLPRQLLETVVKQCEIDTGMGTVATQKDPCTMVHEMKC